MYIIQIECGPLRFDGMGCFFLGGGLGVFFVCLFWVCVLWLCVLVFFFICFVFTGYVVVVLFSLVMMLRGYLCNIEFVYSGVLNSTYPDSSITCLMLKKDTC